jgi:hypothetical protein
MVLASSLHRGNDRLKSANQTSLKRTFEFRPMTARDGQDHPGAREEPPGSLVASATSHRQ